MEECICGARSPKGCLLSFRTEDSDEGRGPGTRKTPLESDSRQGSKQNRSPASIIITNKKEIRLQWGREACLVQTLPPTQTGGRPHFSGSAAPPLRIRDSWGREEGKGEDGGLRGLETTQGRQVWKDLPNWRCVVEDQLMGHVTLLSSGFVFLGA